MNNCVVAFGYRLVLFMPLIAMNSVEPLAVIEPAFHDEPLFVAPKEASEPVYVALNPPPK